MRIPKLIAGARVLLRGKARWWSISGAVVVLGACGWWLARGGTDEEGRGAGAPVVAVERVAARPAGVVTFNEGCATAECHTGLRSESRPGHSACQACHEADAGGHVYPLRDRGDAGCNGCHDTAQRHPFAHNAVADDGCLACHQPHADAGVEMLRGQRTAETCVTCHPVEHSARKHAPFAEGNCDACHDAHGSRAVGLLRQVDVEANCELCHAEAVAVVRNSGHSHRGVEGSCVGCHEAHGSGEKGLLRESARASCLSCHEEIARVVGDAKVSHHPLLEGERCERCHDPHGSAFPGMLRDRQSRVCLECHAQPVTKGAGRSIAAVPEPGEGATMPGHGECSGCHSVHGGSDARLLSAKAATIPMGAYDARNYSLCFGCHDASLAEVGGVTAFMDGEKNLHAAHLRAGEKSRGCTACHTVHGRGEPRLIAKRVNFEGSGWEMEMRFELTREGGRCGAGCHEALEYSREPGGARGRVQGGGG